MLPSPKPAMIADVISIGMKGRDRRPCRSIHRYDLVTLVVHHDVVVRSECIVIVVGERRLIGFDQTFIRRFQILERSADGFRIGRAGLRDRQRENVHGVIGVSGADRREHVFRPLDLRIFLLQRREDPLTDGTLLAEEAVGLHERRFACGRPRKFRKTAAGNAPVRDHRHGPAQALARLHHLCAGRGVADQNDCIGAGILKANSGWFMTTSLASNFSMPGISIAGSALLAAPSPFSLPWPQGLLTSISPVFLAPNLSWANLRSLTSTRTSTAETRKA